SRSVLWRLTAERRGREKASQWHVPRGTMHGMATMKRRVIYLSDEDWATAQEEAKRYDSSISAYFRSLVVGGRVIPIAVRDTLQAVHACSEAGAEAMNHVEPHDFEAGWFGPLLDRRGRLIPNPNREPTCVKVLGDGHVCRAIRSAPWHYATAPNELTRLRPRDRA